MSDASRPARRLVLVLAGLALAVATVAALLGSGSAPGAPQPVVAEAADPAMDATAAMAATAGDAPPSSPPASEVAARASGAGLATATFAGGCFWCVETAFEGRPGVVSVVSGFAGGPERNPTYHDVSAGRTGHLESVEIRFRPGTISYDQLLDIFWHSIDPTQGDGQFCDRGAQYRSAIFVHDAAQRRAAEASKRAIEASGVLKQPIVTRILDAGPFYAAEEYHQDFWKKDPVRYRTYRLGCGRDRRLAELWGRDAAKPSAH